MRSYYQDLRLRLTEMLVMDRRDEYLGVPPPGVEQGSLRAAEASIQANKMHMIVDMAVAGIINVVQNVNDDHKTITEPFDATL